MVRKNSLLKIGIIKIVTSVSDCVFYSANTIFYVPYLKQNQRIRLLDIVMTAKCIAPVYDALAKAM